MQRFSLMFWFTVLAGGLSSLLLAWAVLWFFTTQTGEMMALCRQGKSGCGSWESLQHLYRVACIAQAGGTILLFGLAYKLGRGFLKPALPTVADASQ